MAYSFVTYTGSGTQTDYTFPFPYLDWEDLVVKVGVTPVLFYFLNASAIRLVTPCPTGQTLSIRRITNKAGPVANFTDGSNLLEADLDRVVLFSLYTAQESFDLAQGAVPGVETNDLSPAELLLLLNGKITLSEFALELAQEVDRVSGSEEVIGTVNWRILQEAQARASALSAGLLEEATNRDVALAAGLLSEALARGTAISVERGIRETAEGVIASSVTTLSSVMGNRVAAVEQSVTAVASAQTAQATQLTVVAAAIDTTAAAIRSELNVVAGAQSAFTLSLSGLQSLVGTNQSDITSALSTVANAQSATASSLATLTATVGTNAGVAHNETQVVANAQSVTASAVSVLAGRVGAAEGAIVTEAATRVTERDAYLSRLTSLEGTVIPGYNDTELRGRITTIENVTVTATSANTTAISAMSSAYQAADSSLSGRITTAENTAASATSAVASRASALEAKVDVPGGQTVMSIVAAETNARTTNEGTQASQITTLQSSVTGLGTQATNLSTRIGTVETSAATSAAAVGQVNANYTLKVQARSDGKLAVAGIGLNATANTDVAQSEMVFLADKFQFVSSAGDINGTPQGLLQLGTSNGTNTLVLAATRVGDQTIASRMIVDGTIAARHIETNSISADKIDTRGLTVKDAGGGILFGSGVNLDYSRVGGTKPPANATAGAVIGSNLTGEFTQLSWDSVMTSSFIRNAHIGGDIYSTNYYASGGTAGWIITRAGQAVFNDVLVRGDVLANNIVANTIQGYHIQLNAVGTPKLETGAVNTIASAKTASTVTIYGPAYGWDGISDIPAETLGNAVATPGVTTVAGDAVGVSVTWDFNQYGGSGSRTNVRLTRTNAGTKTVLYSTRVSTTGNGARGGFDPISFYTVDVPLAGSNVYAIEIQQRDYMDRVVINYAEISAVAYKKAI